MSKQENIWLVEIRVKDWKADLPTGGRIVCFEEVLANNEFQARDAGFCQFEKRCQYEPIMKRKMAALGLTLGCCCAPDAVEIS